MRTGEVCALTWDDIDFENRIIKINKTVYCKTKDNKGRWVFGTTKTDGSDINDLKLTEQFDIVLNIYVLPLFKNANKLIEIVSSHLKSVVYQFLWVKISIMA